jgi:hypothetical protein
MKSLSLTLTVLCQDPLSREFIPTLLTKEEALLEQSRRLADDAFIQVY